MRHHGTRRVLALASVAAGLSCAPTSVPPPLEPHAECFPPAYAELGPRFVAQARTLRVHAIELHGRARHEAAACRALCDVSAQTCALEHRSCALAEETVQVCEYADVCDAQRCAVVVAWCTACAGVHVPRGS